MCEPLHTSSDLGLFGARIVRPASFRSRRHFRRREIRQTAEVTYGGLFKVGRVTRDRRFESGLLQRRVSCEPEAGWCTCKKRESSRRRICGLLNSFRKLPFSAWPVSAAAAEVMLLAAQELDQCQIRARQDGMGTPNKRAREGKAQGFRQFYIKES
jgi:hypothetical protein